MERHLDRKLLRTIHTAALCGAWILASAHAGELTVSWPSSTGAAGYRLFIGEQAGVYERVIDVGPDLRATVDGLDDDRPYHFAVKGYDAQGRLAPSYSPELVCMARPRVTSVEVSSVGGRSAIVTLRGANLEAGAQVYATEAPGPKRLEVLRGEPGALFVRWDPTPQDGEASPEAEGPAGRDGTVRAATWGLAASDRQAPGPGMFSVVNPCRRSAEFVAAHPEVADLDGNGRVDASDVAAVRAAVGLHEGDVGFRVEADLDGNGIVDGEDVARVLARLRSERR